MLALKLQQNRVRHQHHGATPKTLTRILEDDVNLAVWQRQLPLHIADFAALLLSLNEPLAQSLCLELPDEDGEPDLSGLAAGFRDLEGYEGFVADLRWLVSAFACLLGARRIGLRLRVLDKAMCPRFHVDHVPVRLITTYGGIGSQWLEEGAMDREQLGQANAEPNDMANIQQLQWRRGAIERREMARQRRLRSDPSFSATASG
jgi:hypothetical protein